MKQKVVLSEWGWGEFASCMQASPSAYCSCKLEGAGAGCGDDTYYHARSQAGA